LAADQLPQLVELASVLGSHLLELVKFASVLGSHLLELNSHLLELSFETFDFGDEGLLVVVRIGFLVATLWDIGDHGCLCPTSVRQFGGAEGRRGVLKASSSTQRRRVHARHQKRLVPGVR
jgi:hypothetical protein